jgi:hypothetical protein
LACVALLCPAAADGQRWHVDYGATSIRYDAADPITGVSLVPQVEWSRNTLHTLVNANLTLFERSTWTAQAWGDVSLLTRPVGWDRRIRIEAATSVGGSVHGDGYSTGSTRGEVRAHFADGGRGAWVGYAAGLGWTSDTTKMGLSLGPTVGAWLDRPSFTATMTWTPRRFAHHTFQEFEGRVVMSRGPVDVAAYAGWRSVPPGAKADSASNLESEGCAGATVAVWVAPRAAVVAAAGTYASDLLQVLPRGRFVSLAVRLSGGRPPVWARAWTGRAVHAPASGTGDMRFRVPSATRVEVAGDWTGWKPVPLTRGPEGRWILHLQLEPGVYRFNLIVDGGRWIVPEGVAAVDDGFGGKAGVLVIP